MLAGILVWAWLVLTLSGTGFAAAVTTMGDLACEADTGDSNYGEMQWSFAPPGPHCGDTWTYEGDVTRSTVEFSGGHRVQTVLHERTDDGTAYQPISRVTLIKVG
jgi:hypothetical protein